MGMNWHLTKILFSILSEQEKIGNVLTLGRLNLNLDHQDVEKLMRIYQIEKRFSFEKGVFSEKYADAFLYSLGAEKVCSIDISNFEEASITHDMNTPVDISFHEKFDLIIDGVTLEHIFHFPTAIKNVMEMLKVGGKLILCTPANNCMGHGFYSFSPELFFRIFSQENGFSIKRLVMYENYVDSQWYQVEDPKQIGQRIELTTGHFPVGMLVNATRTTKAHIFKNFPQQSDYKVRWDKHKQNIILTRDDQKSKKKSFIKVKAKSLINQISSLLDWVTKRNKIYKKSNPHSLSLESQPAKFKPIKR